MNPSIHGGGHFAAIRQGNIDVSEEAVKINALERELEQLRADYKESDRERARDIADIKASQQRMAESQTRQEVYNRMIMWCGAFAATVVTPLISALLLRLVSK